MYSITGRRASCQVHCKWFTTCPITSGFDIAWLGFCSCCPWPRPLLKVWIPNLGFSAPPRNLEHLNSGDESGMLDEAPSCALSHVSGNWIPLAAKCLSQWEKGRQSEMAPRTHNFLKTGQIGREIYTAHLYHSHICIIPACVGSRMPHQIAEKSRRWCSFAPMSILKWNWITSPT
jgi:hypothetical protein